MAVNMAQIGDSGDKHRLQRKQVSRRPHASLANFHLWPQNPVHIGVTSTGGRIMRAQRAWKPIAADKSSAKIEQLYLQLGSLNKRILELEKSHPETSKIEALKVSALVVSRQIDELRCATDDLTGLLAR
jgi:hypothetical protein